MPTSFWIRGIRCILLASHLLWMGTASLLILPWLNQRHRDRLKQCWSRRVLRILSIRLEADFSAVSATEPGCLVLANHISWLDVFVINAALPVSFIAKAEVRTWPLIGLIAEKNDTVFLRRGSRGHAKTVNAQINARLSAGRDVAVFPEGTTTDGTHLLGFHAALLQPAVETKRPILPLALSYRNENNEISLAASFSGNISLMRCFLSILSCRTLTVRLIAAPVLQTSGRNRRWLSQQAHAAIATRLGFPLPSMLPEKLFGLPDAAPSANDPTSSRNQSPAGWAES